YDSDNKMVYGFYINLSAGAANFNVTNNKSVGHTTAAVKLGASTPVGFGIVKNNPNYNPVGNISAPYDNTNNYIGIIPAGGSSTLTSAKVYTCGPVPVDLYLAGGTVRAMT